MPPSHPVCVKDVVVDQSSNFVAFKCDHRSCVHLYDTIITKELKGDNI